MAGPFVVEKGKTGKFSLRSGKSQVVLTSETYETKASAMNGIESVRKNSQSDAASRGKRRRTPARTSF